LLPVVFLGSFLGGPLPEELGWRGFAQPRLQRRFGAGAAGGLIGLAWSLWHLPLLYYYPAATAGITLPYYLPLVVCFGVWFAWMHNQSGGSVFSTILLHAGVNFAFGTYGALDVTGDPARLGALLVVAGLVTGAALLDLRHRLGEARGAPSPQQAVDEVDI
jgi:membrane protease YdiL (CAAX protease family)